MKISFSFIIALLISNTLVGQILEIQPVDNSTYTGKAMFGYQGWFAHPDDDSPRPHYWHWGNMDEIGMIPLEVEMYPDLRELCSDEKYPTAYTLPNGDVAEVFSSGNKQTVLRHMKWVRDYNTDGVFVQRFISEYNDKVVMAFRDSTTVAIMEGCETYGRVFAIMYDGIAGRVEDIKTDWIHLVDDIGILSSDRYLQHKERPLVVLWGYTVRPNATVDQLEELTEFFHNNPDPKYRTSIKLGVNDNWFNNDQRWMDAFSQVEVISPWSVGRYKYQSEYNNYINNQIIPGKNWCTNKGILYVPVLFPGFSWHNLKEGEPKNHIPRNGGNFFWMQAYGAVNNNAESLYFAMFDEVDEGTAFFKTAENSDQAPAQEYWLNLDADGYELPSDWYLRCAGKAVQMLRGNISKTSTLGIPEEGIMTIRPNDDVCKLEFYFPDFDDASIIEISLDGGNTFPYSVADDTGVYEISDLEDGIYNIYVRHPGSVAIPMGNSCINGGCIGTATENQPNHSDITNINIFPNPAQSKFSIEGLDATCQIDIFDMFGNTCKSLINKGIHTSIDISDLPNGLYLVSIKNELDTVIMKIEKIK